MRRLIEAGAVLLFVGCGVGTEPGPLPEVPMGTYSPALDDNDPCSEVVQGAAARAPMPVSDAALRAPTGGGDAPTPDMICENCDPGGGGSPMDFPVPSASNYVRGMGARTYGLNYPGLIRGAFNLHLKNTSGAVIGHVSFGATKTWLALHVRPTSGDDVRVRIGQYRSSVDGTLKFWIRLRTGSTAWTAPMITAAAVSAYISALPAAQQNFLRAGVQALADTRAKQDPNDPNYNFRMVNDDGTCGPGTWIAIAGFLVACPESLGIGCGLGVGAALACLVRLLPDPSDCYMCGAGAGLTPQDGLPAPIDNTLADSGDPVPASPLGDYGTPSGGSTAGGECW